MTKSLLKWPAFLLAAVLMYCLGCTRFHTSTQDHPDITDQINQNALLLAEKDPARAKNYVVESFSKISQPGPGDLYIKYVLLCTIYSNSGMYTHALKYTDSMINVLKPFANKKQYNLSFAEAHLYKGDVLFRMKQYNDTYLQYYVGKSLAIPDPQSRSYKLFLYKFNMRLADICYKQGRYLEGVTLNKNAVEALSTISEAKINFDRIGTTNNLALNFSRAGIADSALFYYKKALLLIKKLKPKNKHDSVKALTYLGVIYGNIGTAYSQLDSLTQAEQKFKESIAINSKPGFANEDALITKVKLAHLYVKEKKINDAKQWINNIGKAEQKLTLPQYKMMVTKLRSDYAALNENTTEAYHYLRLYDQQVDSLNKVNRVLLTTDFDREFTLLRNRYNLQSLQRQDDAKTFYLICVAIACIMLGVIAYLTFKSRKQAALAATLSIEHNRQLELTLDALEHSNHEYAHLMRVVAHDLKNPINAINGISTLMKTDKGRSTEDIEMLDLICISSVNLNTIINDLLFSKTIVDDTARQNVDLGELLEESTTLLQFRAKEKQQVIELIAGRSVLINVNRERVWRVINNLIVNAIKFSPQNTTIKTGWKTEASNAIIFVRDQGIGVPEKDREKIFNLFSNAKRKGTMGEESFGIGLYTSKQIIEEHGGKIWLEAAEGKGSVFYISLPIIHQNLSA
ncbi:ATP-binding protein [Mucilaginibacter sp. KACC 22063]|uniref:ATP-binding protein n=1 Tax=Mucilaginibacter sp. KACC 22063 TaxID=3025666 RepID=UPI0023650E36|nr:HAMP domain-containing sensor histidine kinase [Mucilaginibacter sp. KACC 22063]WDF54293.1 HAMP domain-containing sensor histidine kinase [Mucilaginibacter sp. KACC 22063]